MQVSVESTGEIERKIMVEVPAERIDQEVDKRLKGMRGKVRIDGFRPGKVPVSVVKERYGDSVFHEVAGEVIQQTLYEAAGQENLRIAGMPSNVEPEDMGLGKPLKYTATVEIYPEFEIAALDGLEITRQTVDIVDADIDKMIEILQKQQKTWKEVDRAAVKGDQVIVTFDGTIDGESFDGGKAENTPVEVESGQMLPEFDAALVDMAAGDEKSIDVTFPEDYQAEDLKGKTATFKITVSKVNESIIPDVDAEFYKLFGVDDGSEESFRADVKKNMTRELGQRLKASLKESVMNGLADLHSFETPKSLIKDEVGHIRKEMSQSGGYDASTLPDELFKDQAERRVKLGLVVGEIIKKHDIQKDEAKVDAMLEELSASYDDATAVIEYYKTNPQAMQSVDAAVMEEVIVDWVLEQSKVSDKATDFYSVMNSEAISDK